jgi:hypothetical protein
VTEGGGGWKSCIGSGRYVRSGESIPQGGGGGGGQSSRLSLKWENSGESRIQKQREGTDIYLHTVH